jgi:hypothetical protein
MCRTIAEFLDLDLDSSDHPNARLLREALAGARNKTAPQAASQTLTSTPSVAGMVTELHLQALGGAAYFDSAVSSRQEYLAAEIDRPRWNWHWPRLKRLTISFSSDNDQ